MQFDDAPKRARRKVKLNDIIISTVRPNLKHYYYFSEVESNFIVSTGFAVISSKMINPRYLYYFVTSQFFTDYLTQ